MKHKTSVVFGIGLISGLALGLNIGNRSAHRLEDTIVRLSNTSPEERQAIQNSGILLGVKNNPRTQESEYSFVGADGIEWPDGLQWLP